MPVLLVPLTASLRSCVLSRADFGRGLPGWARDRVQNVLLWYQIPPIINHQESGEAAATPTVALRVPGDFYAVPYTRAE